MRSLRSLLLLTIAVLAAGCDTNKPDEDGSFRFDASSPVNTELSGRALFAPGQLNGNVTFEVQFQSRGTDDRVNIYLNRPVLNQFDIGSYQITNGEWADVKSPAREVIVYVTRRAPGSDVVQEWKGRSGALRVTTSVPGELVGTIDITVASYADPNLTMRFSGSFRAVRGV